MAKKPTDKTRRADQTDFFPSRDLDKYVVRMPDGLRDRIKRVAEETGRSMNSEIVLRLEASLERDEIKKVTKEDVEQAQALAQAYETNERLLAALTEASERLETATRRHMLRQSGALHSIANMFEAFMKAVKREKGSLTPEVNAMGEDAVINARHVAEDWQETAEFNK